MKISHNIFPMLFNFIMEQEDTLACILALDGFYHDGRNVRASYGTSKYCSAFIKNVRCNNPDCTYLHHMGDAEDTFTKQEIQAGYVTSGRDVLARQQQIMAQQAAAAFGNGGNCRKRVGGGGPSSTGKASASPIFPPPTFDEPVPRKAISKAQSTILQPKAVLQPGQQLGVVGNVAPSAASIVAGIGTTSNVAPHAPHAPHATLTTLTSLKRAGSMPLVGKSTMTSSSVATATFVGTGGVGAKPAQPLVGTSSDLTPAESLALEEQFKEAAFAQQQQAQQMMQAQKSAKQKQQQQQHALNSSRPNSPSESSVGSGPGIFKRQTFSDLNGVPIIGAISGSNLHMGFPLIGATFSSGAVSGRSIAETPISNNLSTSMEFGGSGILGGKPLAEGGNNGVIGGLSLSSTGNTYGLGLLTSDKWGNTAGSRNLWGGDSEPVYRPAPIGPANSNGIALDSCGDDVGGMSLFGTNNNAYLNENGSSALASMLGIDLPMGLGTLRENSSTISDRAVRSSSTSTQAPVGSSSVASAVEVNVGNRFVGAIGVNKSSNGMPQPIGGQGAGDCITIGGYSGGGGNNDMALLQSLLPGVNITSGDSFRPAAPQHPHYQLQQLHKQTVGVGGLNPAQWNSGSDTVGKAQQQNDQHQRDSNIW
jgi:hypothetical protein